jgi:acyl dehydratase
MNIRAEFALPPCIFELGESFRRELSFDADSIRHFATMCGDTNPLHHDEAYVRGTRFGGLIASGGHYSALMMGAVADYMTKKGDALGLEFSFRFLRAVPAGARLDLVWTVRGIEAKPRLHGHILSLEGELLGPDGEVFVSSTCKGLAVVGDRLTAG